MPEARRLRQLVDVAGTPAGDAQALVYDQATGRWGPAALGTASVADGAVTAPKLANLAVATGALQDSAVTGSKLAGLAVATGHLQDGAVTGSKLANLVVATAHVQDGAITGSKLANLAVATTHLQDGAVADTKLGTRLLALAAPTSDTATLTGHLSGLAYQLKALSGKADWKTAPALSLEALAGHKARHASGGADALTPGDIGAAALTGAIFNGDVGTGTRYVFSATTADPAFLNGYAIRSSNAAAIDLVAPNLRFVPASGTTYLPEKIWREGNDGPGSTLDADLLDGVHASALAPLASPSFTGTVTAPALTVSNGIVVPGASAGLEVGSVTAPNTPYLDFHSSGANQDFDVRLLASGGVAGTTGAGVLAVSARDLSLPDLTSCLLYQTNYANDGLTTTAGQPLTAGAANKLVFMRTLEDTRGLWDGVNHQFVPSYGGYYAIACHVAIAATNITSSGQRFILSLYRIPAGSPAGTAATEFYRLDDSWLFGGGGVGGAVTAKLTTGDTLTLGLTPVGGTGNYRFNEITNQYIDWLTIRKVG